MFRRNQSPISWIDVIWIVFLGGLALLPPVNEVHKQLTLLGFAVFQLLEGRLIALLPQRGRAYSVVIKILLATLLIDHTGGVGINSSYYPIYYLPVATAAIYFGPVGTLFWTTLTSLAYCSYLIPARQEYEITTEALGLLAIRILFFYLAAMLVNRFANENRTQMLRYQQLSETLEETNRQLRQAEAEARRSERLAALGQMSAGLAHEIRNPLGVIKGSAEILTQKLKDAQPLTSELAGYISSEVNRLNALVARFLDFARPSRLELRSERLTSIADRAIESASHQFPDSPVAIERVYTNNLPQTRVDTQLCEQVFINLIVNAYQAMHGRSGKIRVCIAPESSHGHPGAGVIIEDSGPGVPAELREQIFNPFFTSKKDGVGLGLSIVAKIVDDHRGAIRLEESPAGGARFHVFFPSSPDT